MTTHSLPDADLIRAVAQGDAHALDALYQRHSAALLAYLIGQVDDRALAEEVLQDVMLAVWRGAGQFRHESSVHTWMLAIARRQAIRARQQQTKTAPISDTLAATHLLPLEALERQRLHADLNAALDQLPPDQRETLELIFYHELTAPEVAAVMDVAVGTVKSRLRRAKTLLQRLLRLQEYDHA
jgi:RNA polymerase sigma-70 factor (ECF subfamily)